MYEVERSALGVANIVNVVEPKNLDEDLSTISGNAATELGGAQDGCCAFCRTYPSRGMRCRRRRLSITRTTPGGRAAT